VLVLTTICYRSQGLRGRSQALPTRNGRKRINRKSTPTCFGSTGSPFVRFLSDRHMRESSFICTSSKSSRVAQRFDQRCGFLHPLNLQVRRSLFSSRYQHHPGWMHQFQSKPELFSYVFRLLAVNRWTLENRHSTPLPYKPYKS